MNIQVIAVGKIKEKFHKEAIGEFEKRLRPYCKLEIIEIPDEKAPENLSPLEMDQVKSKEAERILKRIPQGAYVIGLHIEGQKLSSEGLADKINQLALEGRPNLSFLIGGSLGLSSDLEKITDYKISFSKMTFPHQIMRLILLEQVYRSFKIIRNEPYHK